MTYYTFVAVILIYEIFAGLQVGFCKQGVTSPVYAKSAIERRIFSSGSNLDLIFLTFGTVTRINGIVFLVYLGYKTTWWHPVIIWVCGLVLMTLFSFLCKGRTGFTIPAFLAFLVLPISAAYLWYAV